MTEKIDIYKLNSNFFEFILKNLNTDINQLFLTCSSSKFNFPFEFAITQIQCRQKAKVKLSEILLYDKFLFPNVIITEQSTNQIISKYHASLIGRDNHVLDMTAGLGIDAMSIAKNGNTVTAIEIDNFKASILEYNKNLLNLKDLTVVNDDSIKYLKNNKNKNYDVIFIDPARRNEKKKRVHALSQCNPDILSNFNLISQRAKKLYIKASPMLDITQVFKEISKANEIELLCMNGECKEILIICDFNRKTIEREIKVLDFNNSGKLKSKWTCLFSDFKSSELFCEISDFENGTFLYEPNAGLQKLNIGKKLCEEFSGLKRVSPNTNLYCSKLYFNEFPGRKFRIERIADKPYLKSLKGKKMEIVARNYPLSAENLRNKLGALSGDNSKYILGCRIGKKEKPVIVELSKTQSDINC